MFVMLSVRSTTVRERQTNETVVKKVNNNNINSIVAGYKINNNNTNNNNNNRLQNQNHIDKSFALSPTILAEKDTSATTIIITEKQQPPPPPRSKSNLSLTELNNYKTPATVQVSAVASQFLVG
jgi:hypothetical protein